MTTLPLDDVLVVSIDQAVAAPLATRQLADLGARVIKIERPGGGDFARRYDDVVGGESSVFVWLNRGKESVELDLGSTRGLEILHHLLDRADIFVANLSPRALRSLELDVDSLRAAHPNLISCVISGYPAGSSTADRKAYDALIQAEVGLMSITGSPGAPAKSGISVADIAAGSFAFSGILAALRHRDRTGMALPVEVSLFQAMAEWMGYPFYYARHSGVEPVPIGTSHPTIAPYGAITTAGGHRVMLAVQNEREWHNLCTSVLEKPELAEDSRFSSNSARVANRKTLDDTLADCFRTLDRDTVVTRLQDAQIAWSNLNSLHEALEHPALADDSRWITTQTPNDVITTLRPHATPGGRCAEGGSVPAFGEHTASVLEEFGLAINEEAIS